MIYKRNKIVFSRVQPIAAAFTPRMARKAGMRYYWNRAACNTAGKFVSCLSTVRGFMFVVSRSEILAARFDLRKKGGKPQAVWSRRIR